MDLYLWTCLWLYPCLRLCLYLWLPLSLEVNYICELHHLTAVECHLTGMVDDAVATDNSVTVFLKDDADTELAPQLLGLSER